MLAKGIVFVPMRGNVFVLLRGIVNGDPVRGQMFPVNIRRYFAFFISYVNIAMSRLLGKLSGLDSDIIHTNTNMVIGGTFMVISDYSPIASPYYE